MDFSEFNGHLQRHVRPLLESAPRLYIANADPERLWNLYLDSFPAGTNEVFRTRREYDCTCCRRFIQEFGAVVFLVDGQRKSIWGFDVGEQFGPVVKALNEYVLSRPIRDVYLPIASTIGTKSTTERIPDTDRIHTWNHFHVQIPSRLVHTGRETVDTVLGDLRTTRAVFRRGLEEISLDAVDVVLDLISQGSLYRGDEWRNALDHFKNHHLAYNRLDAEARELYLLAVDAGPAVSRIRNHSIGTLLTDLTNGVEVDAAVRKFEAVVAPENYKRPNAIYTKKMVEDARKGLEGLGMLSSLDRRFASLSDVSPAHAHFVDRDASPRMAGGVFDELTKQATESPKNFSRAEEIPLTKFLTEVLPGATQLEVLFEKRHSGCLASLLAPKDPAAPSMFKWPNGFAWAYKNNVADSMRERVKAAGGSVEGALRFSIQWNEDGKTNDDLDAHAIEPSGERICFNHMISGRTGGTLDVDIRMPFIDPRAKANGGVAVENIIWPDESRLTEGEYKLLVHNFGRRQGQSGFVAEVEAAGVIYRFTHAKPLRDSESVQVATVTYSRAAGFSITPHLPAEEGAGPSVTVWGLATGQFHRVQLVVPSPNCWGEEPHFGNRHLFFMLNGCISDEVPNGFFNEFLRPDLEVHRRVFAALGAQMRVEPSPDQLSGLGFSSTRRDHLICRVTGRQIKRILKVSL